MENENKEQTGELFDKRVEEYNSFVHGTVIDYDEITESIIDLVGLFSEGNDSPKIVDLGTGTGNTTKAIFEAKPNACVVGFDLSQKMVDHTQKRFKGHNFTAVCDDVANLNKENEFDIAITSIVYHHLSDESKEKAYKKVFKALKTKGVFILADVMTGNEPTLNNHLHDKWTDHMQKQNGKEFKESILAIDKKHHQYAALNDNLKYLNNTGFKTEVYFRKINSAIICAFK